MGNGIETTFRILTQTNNEAAIELLLSALNSSQPSIQGEAIRALVTRREEAGHLEVIRRFPTLNREWKQIVVEQSGRMEHAIRSSILSNDSDLQRNGSDLATGAREYDLIPALITAAEDRGNVQSMVAARAVLNLCERLCEELHAPRDYRNRRDPAIVRQYVYGTLEHAVARFEPHHPLEIVEAFLILVEPDDAVLKQCLRHSNDKIYTAVVGLLSNSSRPAIQRLVLKLLDDIQAPPALAGVVSRRKDLAFLRSLFAKVNRGLAAGLKANLHKIDSFAWVRGDLATLSSFEDAELCGAVRVVVASGMNRLQAFEVVKFALQHGGVLSRRIASEVLAEFKGREANDLTVALLEDPDPQVQANTASQLRDRGIPGIISRLVELVESPHEVVRQAARNSLVEFSFQRYLGTFEMLDAGARRNTGTLVKRVDHTALDQLTAELNSQSRTRRLRALEVAAAMGAVRDLEKVILELAGDVDHFVRAEAARVLVNSPSEAARKILGDLLLDRSVSVREAADGALQQIANLAQTSPRPGPSIQGLPTDLPIELADQFRETLP